MGTPAAPRIDRRLRRYIAGAGSFDSPAEVTRAVGNLAWELGLPRPSYEQVRHLLGGAVVRTVAASPAAHTSRGEVALRYVGMLWEYPGPGLADWYRRYQRGLV
jgi:hypothetical protein